MKLLIWLKVRSYWIFRRFSFLKLINCCITGGKPITPNDIHDSLLNGNTQINGHSPENGALTETVTKTEVNLPWIQIQFTLEVDSNFSFVSILLEYQVSQNQQSPSTGNDKTIEKKNGDANQSNTQISNSVVPGPQSASHVVVEEKKKKKCTCCVIQ